LGVGDLPNSNEVLSERIKSQCDRVDALDERLNKIAEKQAEIEARVNRAAGGLAALLGLGTVLAAAATISEKVRVWFH
jgi:hypothetical protein